MAGIPEWANYREADQLAKSCSTCVFFANNWCEMFETHVGPEMTCDRWQGTGDTTLDIALTAATIRKLEPVYKGKDSWYGPLFAWLSKGEARPNTLHLHVVGVHRAPQKQRIYRLSTRDGHYIGRTNPTTVRAMKGDVVTVDANHFTMDSWGNVHWENPNVVSRYPDRAHSFRELEALAGDRLEKDSAPGEAGDIPPAGDEGGGGIPSGPTLAAVHIPAPLPDISVAYAGRSLRGKQIKVVKAAHKQLVYGVVLEPHSLDSQADIMAPDEVEATAHGYLKKAIRGQSSVTKLQHRAPGFQKDKPSLVPVESFIAPVDFSYDGKERIAKGSWVIAMHCEDPILWQDFLDGKYTGFSVGGSGIRQAYSGEEGLAGGDMRPPPPDHWNPNQNSLGFPVG